MSTILKCRKTHQVIQNMTTTVFHEKKWKNVTILSSTFCFFLIQKLFKTGVESQKIYLHYIIALRQSGTQVNDQMRSPKGLAMKFRC